MFVRVCVCVWVTSHVTPLSNKRVPVIALFVKLFIFRSAACAVGAAGVVCGPWWGCKVKYNMMPQYAACLSTQQEAGAPFTSSRSGECFPLVDDSEFWNVTEGAGAGSDADEF